MSLSHDEALYLFVDGELDAALEEPLFSELAYNESLRNELKDLLFMRNTVKRDDAAPPLYVKDNLLTAVGLATTALGAGGGAGMVALSEAAGNTMQWWNALWFKVALPIATAVVGATLVWFVEHNNDASQYHAGEGYTNSVLAPNGDVWSSKHTGSVADYPLNNNPQNSNTSIEHSATTPTQQQQQDIDVLINQKIRTIQSEFSTERKRLQAANSSLRTALDGAVQKNSELSNTNSDLRSKIAAVEQENSGLRKNVAAIQTPREPQQSQQQINSQPSVDAMQRPMRLNPPYITLRHNAPITLDGEGTNTSGFTTLRIRGLNSQSITTAPMRPESSSLLDNAYLGIMYQITPGFSAGLEVGREAFVQSYHGRVSSRVMHVQQYPQLWNLGVVMNYRLASFDVGAPIDIIGESTLGGAMNGGPLARQALGLRYAMGGNVSMFAGAQLTGMGFQFQDTWFSTFKYGLMYGINYSFN